LFLCATLFLMVICVDFYFELLDLIEKGCFSWQGSYVHINVQSHFLFIFHFLYLYQNWIHNLFSPCFHFFFFAFIKFYLLFLCSCNPNLDLHIFHCQGSLMQFTATSDDVLCSGYDSVFHYNDYDLFYKKFLMRDLKRDMVTMNILIH
jgi:hypothetical protein